jgi:hypothetical protein
MLPTFMPLLLTVAAFLQAAALDPIASFERMRVDARLTGVSILW